MASFISGVREDVMKCTNRPIRRFFYTLNPLQNRRLNRREVGQIIFWWGTILLIFLMLFFITWERVQVYSLGYKLAYLHKEKQRLEDIQRCLRIEVSALESPKRIEAIASEKLGFVKPEEIEIVQLSSPIIPEEILAYEAEGIYRESSGFFGGVKAVFADVGRMIFSKKETEDSIE